MEIKGGDKLSKILAEFGGNEGGFVKVGFMPDAKYDDGTYVASVAFWNEFGHGGRFPAPPRPFFRNMISEKSGEWGPLLARGLKYNDYDAQKTLDQVGEHIVGELQESITKTNAPQLSETTLMLRSIYGNNPQEIRARDVLAAQELVREGVASGVTATQSKPLIWTGHMMNSVTHVVEAK